MIRPPIIVFDETSEPIVFEHTKCVEGYLEAIDVNLYAVYDADARRLPLLPNENHLVTVGEPEEGAFYAEELISRLTRSLQHGGFDVDADVPLEALVALSVVEYSYITVSFRSCLAAPFVALWDALRRRPYRP